MDLRLLDTQAGSDSGFELRLVHPATREPLEIWITVYGKDGALYEQKSAEIKRNRLERASRNLPVSAAVDAVDDDALELLAACTKGWRGIGEENPIEFSVKAAGTLYRKYKWIYEQVDAAVHTRANFLPGDASSSARSPAISST